MPKYSKTGKYPKRSKKQKSPFNKYSKNAKVAMYKPVEYYTSRSKIFNPLPSSLGVKTRFTSDPQWVFQTMPNQSTNMGWAKQAYMWLNLTDMSRYTSRTQDAQWHSTNHLQLCGLYNEFLYSTTYISMDMVLDNILVDPARPQVSQVQVAAMICPRNQLKRTIFPIVTTPPNTIFVSSDSEAVMYTGMDYYGMITGKEGCKQTVLTMDGTRGGQKLSFKVDAFEHDGSPFRVTNSIRMSNDTDFSYNLTYPIGTPNYTSLAGRDQQVLLIAFRWLDVSDLNQFRVRANLTCDQHWTYSDLFIPAQDMTYNPATQEPDGN